MKKIITLMLAVGMITVASAQQNKQIVKTNKQQTKTIQVKSVDYARASGSLNMYSFSLRQKQEEISRINRQYDQKISIIQRSRSARTAAMGRKVRQLEQDRDAEIRIVEARYDHARNNARTHTIVKTNRSDKW